MSRMTFLWPVIDEKVRASDLLAEARADMPRVALMRGFRITGTPSVCIREGRFVPGSGGARCVVVGSATVEAIRQGTDPAPEPAIEPGPTTKAQSIDPERLQELVAARLSDAQIAIRLGVSARTVLRYRRNLGIESRWAS